MDENALSFFKKALYEHRVFIGIVIALMITSLVVVKIWITSGDMPKFFRTAFGVGRDYRAELQTIVTQHYKLTRGLTWVYGSDNGIEPASGGWTGMRQNVHSSYIVVFGADRMVIIPVLVQDEKIIGYAPIVVTRDNISGLKYSSWLKSTTLQLADNPEPLTYQVLGEVEKGMTFADLFSRDDETRGKSIQPDIAETSSSEIVSRVTISQREEQAKYAEFIRALEERVARK